MNLVKITINKGQELMQILEREFKKRNIIFGSIASIIGAVDSCTISNMPKKDALKDIVTQYNEPMEFSGTGEIKDGKPHIHATLSREDNTAIHGHLHKAFIKNWFISVYLIYD